MKAILVVDVPSDYGDIVDNKVIVTLRNYKLGTSLEIYNIPLKPMPKTRGNNEEWLNEYHRDDYADGWNACINEILGKTK